MSQDPEALSQIESLLRTLSRQYSLETSGGNFTVYTLKNAGASEVAQTLEKLFENMPFTTRGSFSRVAIVADERLNALIVHGRPNDRGLIAELLQVLDSSNVSELFISGPPVIVPLQHTDAARVMEILQGVYASQLKSGGTGPRINIPRGIPSEVATALQQMNAAAAGPLLTLQVDDVTNSIVILAPKVLAEEVSALVQQLDQRAEAEDTRRIGIVPLKSAKAEQLQEALQDLLRGPRRRRGP
jgi:type II secretory pathway component GspD/PulD (secretin)